MPTRWARLLGLLLVRLGTANVGQQVKRVAQRKVPGEVLLPELPHRRVEAQAFGEERQVALLGRQVKVYLKGWDVAVRH